MCVRLHEDILVWIRVIVDRDFQQHQAIGVGRRQSVLKRVTDEEFPPDGPQNVVTVLRSDSATEEAQTVGVKGARRCDGESNVMK